MASRVWHRKPDTPRLRPLGSHWSVDGLVGYWLFHEGAGGIVHDLTGHGYHATITSADGYSWEPGPRGAVLRMSGYGKDNYVQATLPATDYYGITIIFSTRLAAAAEQNMWFQGGIGRIFFRPKDNDWFCEFQDGSRVLPPAGTDDDVWHQYALTFDGTNVRAYRDGLLLNTMPGGNYFDVMSQFRIIGDRYEYNVDGDYDNVVLYNHALSAAELQAYADNPLVALHPRSLGLWRYGEAAGVNVALAVAEAQAAGLALTPQTVDAAALAVAQSTAQGLAVSVANVAAVGLAVATATAAGLPAAVVTPSAVVLEVATGSAQGVALTPELANTIALQVAEATAQGLPVVAIGADAVTLAIAEATAQGIPIVLGLWDWLRVFTAPGPPGIVPTNRVPPGAVPAPRRPPGIVAPRR